LEAVCTNDLGAGWSFDEFTDSDHNGHSCWTGAVPVCIKQTGNLEEYYYTVGHNAIPAPHTFVPATEPQFLLDVMNAYANSTSVLL